MSEKLLITLIVIGLLAVVVGPMILRSIGNARIQKKGVRARARILEIQDTGSRRNKNPVVRIKLTVADTNGREFPGEVEVPVSPVFMSRFQPGRAVWVKYLPASPANIVIDE
jgi:type II secretory pathway pseudopilin PulG